MNFQFTNKKKDFWLSLGYTISYTGIIVILPIAALIIKSSSISWEVFWKTISSQRVLHSYFLSMYTSFIAAFVNLIMGFFTAWVLVRYEFPLKKIINSMIDLPFALPTAVAGISLSSLYGVDGWIGKPLQQLGIKVSYTPLGIIIALIFIGIPFVVRTVQPVLEELEPEIEEAALSLGATPFQKNLYVVIPRLYPALLTGFVLSFARGLGEYGSIVFIAGNIPMVSEISPLLIIMKLEQYDYAGATSIALVLLFFSFFCFFIINYIQWRNSKKYATST